MAQTILVVDDEESVRGLLSSALAKHGYNMLTAANAQDAKHLWTESAPPVDLLLMDVRLEEEDDGFVLADKLLALRPNVPVMFISGDRDCFASPAVQRFGDSPFIRKPFDVKKLAVSVRDLLAQSGR